MIGCSKIVIVSSGLNTGNIIYKVYCQWGSHGVAWILCCMLMNGNHMGSHVPSCHLQPLSLESLTLYNLNNVIQVNQISCQICSEGLKSHVTILKDPREWSIQYWFHAWDFLVEACPWSRHYCVYVHCKNEGCNIYCYMEIQFNWLLHISTIK